MLSGEVKLKKKDLPPNNVFEVVKGIFPVI